MLFTDASCQSERLTEPNILRLRACDHIDRYKDCGWDCATGYKDGRVYIMVHANSKADLDEALGVGAVVSRNLTFGFRSEPPRASSVLRSKRHRTRASRPSVDRDMKPSA